MEKVFADSSFQDEEAEKCTVEVKPDLIIKEERMDVENDDDEEMFHGFSTSEIPLPIIIKVKNYPPPPKNFSILFKTILFLSFLSLHLFILFKNFNFSKTLMLDRNM